MSPFIVVKYKPNQMVGMYFSSIENGRGYNAEKFPHKSSERTEEFEEEQDVYFCNTEDTAEVLANHLMYIFPQHTWAVAKVGLVMSRPPGIITKARFTERGLLPL